MAPIPNSRPDLGAYYREVDKRLGGILPGGGTPVQPEVLNQLPGPINMGYRYISGIGNKDLELSDKFKRGAIRLAIRDRPTFPGEVRPVKPYQEEYRTPIIDTVPTALGVPVLADRDPAAAPYRYTLGRYDVYDEGDRYTVRDKFDLENEYEDPKMMEPGKDMARAAYRGALGISDPANFLRSYIFGRETPPTGYDIEFSVPKEYGTGIGP